MLKSYVNECLIFKTYWVRKTAKLGKKQNLENYKKQAWCFSKVHPSLSSHFILLTLIYFNAYLLVGIYIFVSQYINSYFLTV